MCCASFRAFPSHSAMSHTQANNGHKKHPSFPCLRSKYILTQALIPKPSSLSTKFSNSKH